MERTPQRWFQPGADSGGWTRGQAQREGQDCTTPGRGEKIQLKNNEGYQRMSQKVRREESEWWVSLTSMLCNYSYVGVHRGD